MKKKQVNKKTSESLKMGSKKQLESSDGQEESKREGEKTREREREKERQRKREREKERERDRGRKKERETKGGIERYDRRRHVELILLIAQKNVAG